MVINQSFESTLAPDWVASGSAGQVCTGPVHEGTCAAEITGAGGSLTQEIGNVTALSYKLWGWIYAAGSATGYIELDFLDANDTLLSPTTVLSATKTGGTYVEGNITVRAPLNTTHARISLVETGWVSGDVLRFDEIGLNSSGCFIATSAYGTDTAQQLDVLRAYRDQVLLKDPLGARFVSLYYKVSPPLANYIAEHPVLRTVVREGLVNPIVSLTTLTQGIWGH
jgi:hypothetical protein